ncbi:ATP synthase F1 subunit gamma [Candidatus Uhrbacteria bacterium]|nr:ATP synthase F1 subunit gamma [Candidatus Uhrbacteria bacterium]
MAISPRLIKRRIRSISNTRKITRAMELVAAAKMRKAVQMATNSRDYSRAAEAIVRDIRLHIGTMAHPLLTGRVSPKNSMVIVVGSNRGLCGGFNTHVLKKAIEFIRARTESHLRIVTVGRRTEASMKRVGFPIDAAFESMADAPHFDKTRPISLLAYNEFMKGNIDRVFLAFTDFKSALTQVPNIKQILPIIPEGELKQNGEASVQEEETKPNEIDSNFLFEPSARAILDEMLPRLIEVQMYQALLESSASEHASRMMAMRNASDNASDIVKELTFSFNQARQASITREISEISAGKAAIE